ncbi:MAG: low-specificity L-threonine aldolase [Chloroflexota bacterium]|nr:MAG: low-specificity L-threonine aldolase [Chloroflexota bacterium]
MTRIVDLRSDTVTLPSPAMREAMHNAELGDDVFGEDPTVNRLEEMAAERLGKEAALLVTSGTQGNLVGVLAHTNRGDEVICGDECHILLYEVAGCAALGSLQLRPVPTSNGRLDLTAVRAAIRGQNVHFPRTGLIAVENTHNRHGGAALAVSEMAALVDVAHSFDIPLHVDGARIFNAAIAHGVPARDLVAGADSVTFCLSKGLSCPVGSMLCGSHEYIARARKYRKMVGGGMRQAGIIAAAGIVALREMVDRLAEDHANAKLLAEGFGGVPGIEIDLASIVTNIVMFRVRPDVMNPEDFRARLDDRGVRVGSPLPDGRIRAVTHYGIVADDIRHAVQAAASVMPVAAR